MLSRHLCLVGSRGGYYRSRSFTGLSLVLARFSVSGDKPFRYFDWASSDLGPFQSGRNPSERRSRFVQAWHRASPDYLQGRGMPTMPSDLGRHSVIIGPAPPRRLSPSARTAVSPPCALTASSLSPSEGATASAVAGLTASSENSARAELETGQLVRVLPDRDFGSMEVNALFVSGKTIKPAARAFADFLLRELRAA